MEIIVSLLQICAKGETSPYRITFKANINCTIGRRMLDSLCLEGLLTCQQAKAKMPPCTRKKQFNRVNYFITEEGRALLRLSSPLIELSNKLSRPRTPKLLFILSEVEKK
jgi:predicted transcriptional regulator